MSDVLSWLLPLILGGGAGGGLLAWWVAKKKTPAEVDNIIVGGAETAVLLIRQALEDSERLRAAEATRHAAERDRLTAIITGQHSRILDLEAKLDKPEHPPAV